MKRLLPLIVLFLLAATAGFAGEDFYEARLNKGLRNSETYSYLLMEQSRENRAGAGASLQKALTYSPDLPMVYFELAKASFYPSGSRPLTSIDYMVQGINAYSRNFLWSFTLAGSLFFGLMFSLLLTFTLIVIVRLVSDIPLIAHDLGESRIFALFFAGLGALSLFGPLLFLSGVLIILGIYMRKLDRAVVYLFLALLALSPLFFRASALFINGFSSGAVKAVAEVNESRDNDYALLALKNDADYTALFSYALALKRNGRFDEAISVYKRLLDKQPSPAVYVNLGNCYVGLYNFEEEKKFNLDEAIKYYTTAIGIKPSASGYYNLSQVSREKLDFSKGQEYFKASLSLDRDAVSTFRAISGRNPNRLVVDETLASAELWKYAVKKSGRSSTFGLATVPPAVLSGVSLFLLAGFLFLNKKLVNKAYRCRKCDAILCRRCEKRLTWGLMCPSCYKSLVKLDELDVRERVARLLAIHDHQRKRRGTMKVLSFVLPGSPQIYAGRVLYGFLFLWPFLFFLLAPAANLIFKPNETLFSHDFFKGASYFLAALIYLFSNFITRQKVTKGWL